MHLCDEYVATQNVPTGFSPIHGTYWRKVEDEERPFSSEQTSGLFASNPDPTPSFDSGSSDFGSTDSRSSFDSGDGDFGGGGSSDSLIDVWKVTDGGTSCYFDNEQGARSSFDDESGLTITKIKMHREIFERLPEFDGF